MTGTEVLLLRAIGSVGGAVIAVAVIPPGKWFPIRRILVSFMSGMLLAPVLRSYMGWMLEADSIIASACIVSALSWWTWHAAIKAIEVGWLPWKPAPPKD